MIYLYVLSHAGMPVVGFPAEPNEVGAANERFFCLSFTLVSFPLTELRDSDFAS